MATEQEILVAAAKKGAFRDPKVRALVWAAAQKEGLQIPWQQLSKADVAAFGTNEKSQDYMSHALRVSTNKKRTPLETQWLEAMAHHGLIPGTRPGQIMMARNSIAMGAPPTSPMSAVNAIRGKKKPVLGKMGSALKIDPEEALRTAQQQEDALSYARGDVSLADTPMSRLLTDNTNAAGIDASNALQASLASERGVAGALTRAAQGVTTPRGLLTTAGVAAGVPAATMLAGALPGALGAVASKAVPLAVDAYFAKETIPGAIERYKTGDTSGALTEALLGVGPVAAYGVHGVRAFGRAAARGEALLQAAERAAQDARAFEAGDLLGASSVNGQIHRMTPEFLNRAAADPANPYMSGRLQGGIDRGLSEGQAALGGGAYGPGIMDAMQPHIDSAEAASIIAEQAVTRARMQAAESARMQAAESARVAEMGRIAYLREKLGFDPAPEPRVGDVMRQQWASLPVPDEVAPPPVPRRAPRVPVEETPTVPRPPRAPRKPKGSAANPNPAPAVEVAQGRQLGDPLVPAEAATVVPDSTLESVVVAPESAPVAPRKVGGTSVKGDTPWVSKIDKTLPQEVIDGVASIVRLSLKYKEEPLATFESFVDTNPDPAHVAQRAAIRAEVERVDNLVKSERASTAGDIHPLGGVMDPVSALYGIVSDTRLPHESAGIPTRAEALPGQGSVDVVRAPSDATWWDMWKSPLSHIDIKGVIERLVPNGARISGTLRHVETIAQRQQSRWSKVYKSVVDDVRNAAVLGSTPKERWDTFQRMIEQDRSQRGTLTPQVQNIMARYDALTDEMGRFREAAAQASGMKLEDIAPSIKDIGYWSRQHKGGYQVVRPHTNPDGTVRIERVAFAKNMTEASNEALRIINDARASGKPEPKLQIIEANKGEIIPGVGKAIGKPRVGMNIGRVNNNLEYDRSPQVMQEHINAVSRFGHRVAFDSIIKDAIDSLHPTQTATEAYLRNYRKRFVGAPTNGDVMVGNIIRQNKFLRDRVSDPDRFVRNVLSWQRTATNMMKLRFNLKSAGINLIQPEQTLAPVVGEKIFQASRRRIKAEWQRMKNEHVLIGDTKYDESGAASTVGGGGKWYDVMSNASNVNRAHGYLAGEMHWDTLAPEIKAEFMKNGRFQSEAAARDQYARDMAERTEFNNTVTNRAMAITGPFVETLMQYKGYQIKSVESAMSLLLSPKNGPLINRLGKVGRSIVAPLALGGAKGTLALIGGASAPFVYAAVYDLAKKRGKDDDTAERYALGASEGMTAVGGVNTSAAVQAFDAPFGDTPAEKVGGAVIGPSFGSQFKFATDMWNVLKEVDPHDREQRLWQLVVHQIPQMAGPRLAVEQVKSPGSGQAVGMERTESKNPLLDAAAMTAGFPPTIKTEFYARKERKAARKFMGKNLGIGG